jgi:hypothetical protein
MHGMELESLVAPTRDTAVRRVHFVCIPRAFRPVRPCFGSGLGLEDSDIADCNGVGARHVLRSVGFRLSDAKTSESANLDID